MPPPTWRRALVLGGIRSGKSEFAEALVATDAAVRYVATAVRGSDDPAWAARIDRHRARRPANWATTEVGDDPSGLLEVVASAGAG
jgi:adenosyl cobinamide kinase/adenosyl cobinamide phosphate guanylyltransferase